MKKTILMVAAAGMFAVTGVYAENNELLNHSTETISPAKDKGINPFCKAIVQGDVDTVKRLIELGENVNQKSLGMNPIHFAARYNKAEILTVLIENGADINAKCDKGHTAKKYAELSYAKDALAIIENAMKG